MRTRIVGFIWLACLAPATARAADDTTDLHDGTWRFAVTPYIWAPRIDGTLGFTSPSGSQPVVSLVPINYFDNLNVPFMITGEVHHGAWSIATDLVWVDFSGEKAVVKTVTGPGGGVEIPVDVGSQAGLRGTIWTLGGGYTAFHGNRGSMAVLAGFRYFRVTTSLDWQFENGLSLLPPSGSVEQTDDIWNGVVGVRGRMRFGSSPWFAGFYGDVGTGDSDLTYMGAASVGYAFSWIDLSLAYRDLVFEGGGTSRIERLRLVGPALAIGFRF